MAMKIYQILDKIDEHQLFVPAFQREYVWKKPDAKNLINSLLNDYPTGTMLTWETNKPPELKGPYKYSPSQGSVKLILDGQQRITTLYMLVRGKLPPYYTNEEIAHKIWDLYVNVCTLDLEYFKKNQMENNPRWVHITDIFTDKVNALTVIQKLNLTEPPSNEDQLRIMQNIGTISGILKQDFLEQTIPVKATLREAINIFYIVNSSGVNLTDAELALAQISAYWPDARDQIKAKLQKMAKQGWVFKLDFFVYCLLGVSYHLGSKMEKLHDISNDEPLRKAWKQLNDNTLDYVCNLMREHAYIDHTKEINSVYALVPIIVFAFDKGKDRLTEHEVKKVVKWFYYSQVRTRYISQLPQKLDKDLGIVKDNPMPFDALLNLIEDERRLEIQADEFIGVGIQHPLWSLMKWYFKSKGAKCLTTGIGIRQNMGEKYILEWDHIFPFSVLSDNGYSWEQRHKYNLAMEITNRAILTQEANRGKSATAAKDYLSSVQQRFPNALKLQSIPEDPRLWELENYEFFLQERRRQLASELNEYLTNITETETLDVQLSVKEIIEQGENFGVELKTTLRWDVNEQKVNRSLEEVILKTIAAFSNVEGGILLIGVNNDNEVEGLESDYATLNIANKDAFELHLLNLISNAYGTEMATTGVKVTFPVVEDKEICMVEIRPGHKPHYTEISDKNGAKTKKFFVRRGNSSHELKITEISDYIASRFGSTNA
jgi:hypothetical protein